MKKCTCCNNNSTSVFELNTYSKDDAKANTSTIKTSLTGIKSSLNTFIEDVSTLHDNIDTNGYDTSINSFATLQTTLINNIKVYTSSTLTNDSHAIPYVINKKTDKILSIEKENKAKRNYILNETPITITANNKNRDNFIFDNSTDNKIILTIGNKNTNPQINTNSVILIENTTNFNGFFQVESITSQFVYGSTDGIYVLYSNGLTNKSTEYHSQLTKISVYNSSSQEVSVGSSTTATTAYILGTQGTSITANTTSVSSITLSCDVNGRIKVTAGGGTPFNGFTTSYIIKIEGCSIASYNGYWLVAAATSDTVIELFGGSTTTFNANNLSSNTTTSSSPTVILTPFTSNTDISSTSTVGVSQSLTRSIYLGSSSTAIQGGVTTNVTHLSFSETNGIVTVTANAGTPFSLNFGNIVRIQNTTNFNYYYTVVEDVSSSNTLKLYAGSTLGAADENSSTTATVTPYTSNLSSVAVSTTENKQFNLGSVTVANITADDNADSFLQFKNRTNGIITLEIGKGHNDPTISTGSIIQIQNTTNYNGTYSVKSVDTTFSSTTNGIYSLYAPRLKNQLLERYLINANLKIYISHQDQSDPIYSQSINPRKFNVKIGNNVHPLFYIPSFTLYNDNGYLLEIQYNEKDIELDHSKTENIITKFRLTGKSHIPSNGEELKTFLKQITSTNQDEDNINPYTDIQNLISKLDVSINLVSSINKASYLT